MTLADIATGQSREHLAEYKGHWLNKDILADYIALEQAANLRGFTLRIASGFRDFERQLAIWNAKFRGERPVLDKAGQPLELAIMTELEKCHAILLYSALPGASRHHFGSDLDVFDAAAVNEDYRLRLECDEYENKGPFAPLSTWLRENLPHYGFFLPYDKDRGGVAREPWHISHIQVSGKLAQSHNPTLLAQVLTCSNIEGKATLLAHLDELYARYVSNIARPGSKQ